MNQIKLKNYKLTASIHTLSIKSDGILCATKNTDYITTITKIKDNPISKSKINVNKLMGDVFTYQAFVERLQLILEESKITEYLITRADMRLDSYDPESLRRLYQTKYRQTFWVLSMGLNSVIGVKFRFLL